jgi:uncharacterized protein YdhG (YjbR/CyaY superfamily)
VRKRAASSKRKPTPRAPKDVHAYFAKLSPDARATLEKVRTVIRATVPGAEETISYGIPAFRLNGRVLVWYAAWKSHYRLYPMSAAMIRAAGRAIEGYEISKGTIRFPAAGPIPVALVKTLVKARKSEL